MAHKVAYCTVHGGFDLSEVAIRRLWQLGLYTNGSDVPRHDPRLIRVIEELGDAAAGEGCSLGIAEVSGRHYIIHEYDGRESVIEPYDIQWIVIQ